MKTHTESIIATLLISTLLVSCATPNVSGNFSQNNPCQPGGSQLAESPFASFAKKVIFNPLANLGGTLLATAAANYSNLYTGKLNKLLTKLVTPKPKKKKKQAEQPFYDTGFQQGQPDFNTGYPQTIDPNTGLPVQIDPTTGLPVQIDPNTGFPVQVDPTTGLPVQIDPNTGFPVQVDPTTGLPAQIDPNTGLPIESQQGFDPGQFPEDPNAGLGSPQIFDQGVTQEGFDPNFSGEVQPRGIPGQQPHAIFPPTPCNQQVNAQGYPSGYPQNQQPYGYDPNMAQQGQAYPPYGQDPNNQGQSYDPYGQQHAQNPYGQSDPYAQQAYPSDPYAQGYPTQDPYAQQSYPTDPYAQQGYPQDPNSPLGYPTQDPYAQQSYPTDPYAQPAYPQAPSGQAYPETAYNQQYPTGQSDSQTGTEIGIQTQGTGTPIGLDVVMVKKTIRNGASVVLPIKDGDALKDGRGNAAAGDKFRVMFRPNSDGYVYVIAIDGSGWAQGIFPPPTSPLANPVKAGQQYVLPEGNNWFSLDQYKGIETLFFVASPEKRDDIEEVLQSITGRERPASENPQQVTKVAMVPYGVGGARPGKTPFNVKSGTDQDQTIIPTSYLAQQAGQDLRLTRWFRHE